MNMEKNTMVEQTKSTDFELLLNDINFESLKVEKKVIKGVVVDIVRDSVIIDVGLKSEGRVPLKEFRYLDKELEVLDDVDVFVDRLEDKDGVIVLSHEEARREATWANLKAKYDAGEQVIGKILSSVRGGFTVDVDGTPAFLPGSQLDVRPVKDIESLLNIEQPFIILKMDKLRGNVVLSRRAVLGAPEGMSRAELLESIDEGSELKGVVKNITDYGAFIDLGGIDGLLHITDMSWSRLNHPSSLIQIGESIKVKIIKFNKDTNRISLGIKQLTEDPWSKIIDKYIANNKVSGKVTNIADYGAFVEIENGVEGLIHISEISWGRKNVHPSKVLELGQTVEAMILEVDDKKRRIALGLKQCSENPWKEILKNFTVGQEFEGTINNVTEFGLFVGIMNEFDGMVHLSDLSWSENADEEIKKYQVGQVVKTKILEIDPEKERIALGVKQLTQDPFTQAREGIAKNSIVTCEITEITDKQINVMIGQLKGFIRKNDLAKERSEQKIEKFAVGEKVDAKVLAFDNKNRIAQLSIKAREVAEEKEAVAAYGSTDSGASLGDILGVAIDSAKKENIQKEKARKIKEGEQKVEKKSAEVNKADKITEAVKPVKDEKSEKSAKTKKQSSSTKKADVEKIATKKSAPKLEKNTDNDEKSDKKVAVKKTPSKKKVESASTSTDVKEIKTEKTTKAKSSKSSTKEDK